MRNLTTPDGQSVMLYNSNDPTAAVPPTLINTYSVLTIPAYWRAMNFLSANLASFPRRIHKDGAGLDVPHPLDQVLGRHPNAYQNGTSFWRTLFFAAAHAGNGFARIERGAAMLPVALHNLAPGDVMPFRLDDGTGVRQWYYIGSTKDILPGADVIQLAGLGCDGMVGLDPIHLHADTFQRAKTIDRYQTRFLMRGTVIKGAVEVPAMMSDEQIAEFRARIRSNFTGSDAADDMIILTDGAKLNNATITPQDSQLIQQAAYTTKQIAQITGVPPAFLYDLSEGKYNASVEQAGQDVVRYVFRPWIEQTEDELTGKLLSTADQRQGFAVRMDPAALTRGDTAAITNSTVAQTNAGLRTPNEARALLELPPDPDPKSDKLRLLGDTTPKMPLPEPPKENAAGSRTGPTFAAGQWEGLEGQAMPLSGLEDAESFTVNVHQGGAVGKAEAMAHFPSGTTLDTDTAAGCHSFAVGEHAPHAHPNWVTPALTQTAGPALPGKPDPIHLGHVARMAAGSRIMGQEPAVTVRKPAAVAATPPASPYAALRPVIDAVCARVQIKTDNAFKTNEKKTGQDRTIWVNVFAEQQAGYVAEALGPVSEALVGLGAAPLDVPKLAERYAAQVRQRAATGQAATLGELAQSAVGSRDTA